MSLGKKIKNFLFSKRFLINLVALVLFYVILIFSVNSCLDSRTHFGQKIEVPNLIGKNQKNIDQLMNGLPLQVEILDSIYEPSKVEGTILEQDPQPTELSQVYVKEGRKIKLRVSKRTKLVEVPKLVDKSQRFAEGILRNRKFKYKIEYVPSKEAHGAVLEQLYQGKNVVPGTKIPIGSTIKLIVGMNEQGEPVALPNLSGLTLVEAKSRVQSMGNLEFMAVCQECITSADSASAIVTTQSPEFSEGAIIESGSTITVYAAKQ